MKKGPRDRGLSDDYPQRVSGERVRAEGLRLNDETGV
jgi:hypothetical protein